MFRQLSHELEVTSEAWEIYGTLGISKLLVEDGSAFEKIEVLEGDGGSGTILKKTFMPGYKLVNVLIFFFINNYIYTHT